MNNLNTMNNLKFQAILAKNEIARELREPKEMNIGFMKDCLVTIELWLGEGNQPSVNEILNSDRNDI